VISEFTGKYFFLSNFYKEDETGLTNEHRFQAMKAVHPQVSKEILYAPTAREAKRLGRLTALRPDWDDIKRDMMEMTLRHKFEENPELRQKLINTGDEILIEGNNWGDDYWGAISAPAYRNPNVSPQEYELRSKAWQGKDHVWYGRNELGKLLMKLREEYRGADT
jgi:ribA/ribD-fused uncharacterized protein